MSNNEVLQVRVESLEESMREQGAIINTITDSLHRIELALSQSVAKACPLPGHCVVLENSVKAKWDGDKVRFERLEKRLSENDDWHKQIEQRIEVKTDAIKSELTAVRNTVTRASGALGLLLMLLPLAIHVIKAFFQ